MRNPIKNLFEVYNCFKRYLLIKDNTYIKLILNIPSQ